MRKRVTLDIQYNEETGEYVLPWIENGKRNEARTYHTDSLEDARHALVTQIQWAQRNGYVVRTKGDRFIPELGGGS